MMICFKLVTVAVYEDVCFNLIFSFYLLCYFIFLCFFSTADACSFSPFHIHCKEEEKKKLCKSKYFGMDNVKYIFNMFTFRFEISSAKAKEKCIVAADMLAYIINCAISNKSSKNNNLIPFVLHLNNFILVFSLHLFFKDSFLISWFSCLCLVLRVVLFELFLWKFIN